MLAPQIDLENAKALYDYWEKEERLLRNELQTHQKILQKIAEEHSAVLHTFEVTRAFFANHLGVENPHSYQSPNSNPDTESVESGGSIWDSAIRSSRVQN